MRRFFSYTLDAYYLFRQDLSKLPSHVDVALPSDYAIQVFRSVNDPKLHSLVSFWEVAYGTNSSVGNAEIVSMLQRGDVCIAATNGGSVVGMCWVGGDGAVEKLSFARVLAGERSVCLGHHHAVHPDHRGKKLQRILTRETIKYAVERGSERYYVFVGVNNISSLISLMQVFPKFQVIHHLKIDVPFLVLNFYPCFSTEKWG